MSGYLKSDDLTAIGRVQRTHGIKGELNIELYDPDKAVPSDFSCLIFDLEGIFVPFFVRGERPRGASSCLVELDDVDSDTAASAFVGKEVYVLSSEIGDGEKDDDFLTLEDLVGYRLFDTDGTLVGAISGIDDTTANVLFEVERPDMTSVHVPAAEPLITDVDPDARTLTMNLPTGLF